MQQNNDNDMRKKVIVMQE